MTEQEQLAVVGSPLIIKNIDENNLGLNPQTLAALKTNKVSSILGPDFRVVFLMHNFLSDKTEEEVAIEGARKFIVPQLEFLAQKFNICGHLAMPMSIKLSSPVAVKRMADENLDWGTTSKLFRELKDVPPFHYGVFCFPAITLDESIIKLSETEFLKKLRAEGIDAQLEGTIGSEVKL